MLTPTVEVIVGVGVYVTHASARQSRSGSKTQFRLGGQNCPPTRATHAGPSHAQHPGVVTAVGVGVGVDVSAGVGVMVGVGVNVSASQNPKPLPPGGSQFNAGL